jgi:CHAT domain-containing protein/TPR repeat protein
LLPTALQVLTREAFPQEWAMAQSNLGSTYTQRIRGERVQNLEKAITCCRSALEVLNRKAFPQYWAMTQNNLGIAYWERIDGERDRNLEEAIACYQEALEVGTCEAFPFDWAMIQHNLGIAYHDRIRGERTQNQEKAIACYLAALEFRTREAFPQYWAMTQKSLGIAYYDRVRGKRIQNVEKAIVCYQAALEIYTRKAFPKNYAETQFHLGQAYQDARQFAKAYTAFSAAINTVESLRGEIVSGSGVEGDKQKLAEKYNQIYQCVVEVSLELAKDEPQYYNRAIEYVERSKARNLVELLATRDFYPRGDIPQTVLKELDRLRREIAAEQRQIAQSSKVAQQQNLKGNGRNHTLAVSPNSTRLNALREQLDNLITQEIQPIDPTFSLTQRVEPISYQQIRDLLPDNQTALIEWYITGKTLITAIITRDTTSPRIWQSTSDDLQSLLNWVDQYLTDYSQQKDQWCVRLASRLKELADILHLDEIFSYPELEKCDRLILIPHRYLHLFPLHALEVKSQNAKCQNEDSSPASQCLLDLFPGGVSYAPSCQLLQLAQTRQQSNFTRLFALQNPTGNLAYTDVEITAIKCHFKSADIRKRSAATKVAIREDCLNKAHCVHFSCHGSFNLDFPLESALELADAPLTLGEIFALNLERARLVTLSACETGLTDPTSLSDEYIGLPSGFLYARSPNVVSSLWRVSDLCTAFLMIRFYQNMHQGLPVAVALNQAQRWLRDMTRAELEQWIKDNQLSLSPTLRIRQFRGIKANEKPFQSAFHWAAFCAIGQYG